MLQRLAKPRSVQLWERLGMMAILALWNWFLTWWYVILPGWIALAAVVGLVVGRVIRNRDRQEAESPTKEQVQKIMQDLPQPKAGS